MNGKYVTTWKFLYQHASAISKLEMSLFILSLKRIIHHQKSRSKSSLYIKIYLLWPSLAIVEVWAESWPAK